MENLDEDLKTSIKDDQLFVETDPTDIRKKKQDLIPGLIPAITIPTISTPEVLNETIDTAQKTITNAQETISTAQKRITDNFTNTVASIIPEWVSPTAATSPAYAPGSPVNVPGSPAYAPGSPAYAPGSPAYAPGSTQQDPNTPEESLPGEIKVVKKSDNTSDSSSTNEETEDKKGGSTIKNVDLPTLTNIYTNLDENLNENNE